MTFALTSATILYRIYLLTALGPVDRKCDVTKRDKATDECQESQAGHLNSTRVMRSTALIIELKRDICRLARQRE